MKKIAIVAIGLAGLALSACAPRYYDDRYGRDGRYYGERGHIEYTDHDPLQRPLLRVAGL